VQKEAFKSTNFGKYFNHPPLEKKVTLGKSNMKTFYMASIVVMGRLVVKTT